MCDFKYIASDSICLIQNLFIKTFSATELNKGNIGRENLYKFTRINDFIEIYHQLARDIVINLSLDKKEVCLQPHVTIREFKEGAHGTSFHTDYLYGHGINTYTIWTPLYGLTNGNSFWVSDKITNHNSEDLVFNYSKELEMEMLAQSFEVLPPENQCAVFSANCIHGSPINKSSITRYSFDFRVSLANDKTSTKKIDEYFFLKNNKWIKKNNPFTGLLFLKYICGGLTKDTTMQHEIIEYAAKNKKIEIVAQEAEIERFGYKVFERYLKNDNHDKGFNAIIIASSNILDTDCINLIKTSKVKVFSALDGIFLN